MLFATGAHDHALYMYAAQAVLTAVALTAKDDPQRTKIPKGVFKKGGERTRP